MSASSLIEQQEIEQQLLALYQEWRELTHRERESILAQAWVNVQSYQTQKYHLQDKIVRATDSLQRRFGDSGLLQEFWNRVRRLVAELVQLEAKNGELIGEHKDRVQSELIAFDQAQRSVSRLNRSRSPQGAASWSSYG